MNEKYEKNSNKKPEVDCEIASKGIGGQPETAFELINKYGTYEIQPTNDSENEYPQISQALPKKYKDKEKIKD